MDKQITNEEILRWYQDSMILDIEAEILESDTLSNEAQNDLLSFGLELLSKNGGE